MAGWTIEQDSISTTGWGSTGPGPCLPISRRRERITLEQVLAAGLTVSHVFTRGLTLVGPFDGPTTAV